MSLHVLVAGGAGFLGSHLCDRLLALDCRVMAIDNLATGAQANLAAAMSHPRFEFVRADIEDIAPLTDRQRRFDAFDVIFNLAACASPRHYQRDPIKTLTTSVIGTRNLLELARRHGARFIQSSTSEVYGDPLCHPQREDYWGNVNPIGPRACYDEGKRAAETLCFDYARVHRISIGVARIFNTYGPRMRPDDGRVVAHFVVNALRREPLVVQGDGRQTRSFCYVSDLIDGLIRLMLRPGAAGPFNLGNPRELTVLQLAHTVAAQVGVTPQLQFVSAAVDDPRRRRPCIDLAMRELDWMPHVPVETGLRSTIAYFREQLADEESAREERRAAA